MSVSLAKPTTWWPCCVHCDAPASIGHDAPCSTCHPEEF